MRAFAILALYVAVANCASLPVDGVHQVVHSDHRPTVPSNFGGFHGQGSLVHGQGPVVPGEEAAHNQGHYVHNHDYGHQDVNSGHGHDYGHQDVHPGHKHDDDHQNVHPGHKHDDDHQNVHPGHEHDDDHQNIHFGHEHEHKHQNAHNGHPSHGQKPVVGKPVAGKPVAGKPVYRPNQGQKPVFAGQHQTPDRPKYFSSGQYYNHPSASAYNQAPIHQGPSPIDPGPVSIEHGQVVPIAIIQQDMAVNPDGSFHNVWESENGIKVQEEGTVRVIDRSTSAQTVNGQVAYTDYDGNHFHLKYVADEFGFHPVGDHLPTPPPIPIGIARGLEWIAAHPPPKESQYEHEYEHEHEKPVHVEYN